LTKFAARPYGDVVLKPVSDIKLVGVGGKAHMRVDALNAISRGKEREKRVGYKKLQCTEFSYSISHIMN
jgi:hypothetical protein